MKKDAHINISNQPKERKVDFETDKKIKEIERGTNEY